MITRVSALRLGAPFSFVALTPEMATAPGQLTLKDMHSILSHLPNPQKPINKTAEKEETSESKKVRI